MAASNVIRELLIRLGVTIDPNSKSAAKDLEKQLDTLKEQVSDLASLTLDLGKGLAALLLGAATAAGVLAVETGKDAEAIERQARALNLSRREYQEVLAVFESFGADAGEVADVFQQINDKAIEALAGSEGAVMEFGLLGITADQLRGKRPHEIFELIAEGSANATDRMKSIAGVSKLLGEDSAKKMAPALALGAAEIRRLRHEAGELGLVMDDQALRTAKAAQVEWRKLTAMGRGLRHELGVALAPAVTRVFRAMTEWIRANRELLSQRIEFWVRQATRLVEGLHAAVQLVGGWDVVLANVAVGVGMLTLIANLDRVEKLLAAIRMGIAALQVVAAPALAAITVPLLPLAFLLAGFLFFLTMAGLAVQDFITYWRGGQSVLGDNLKLIGGLVRALRDGAVAAAKWGRDTGVGLWRSLLRAVPALRAVRDLVVELGRAFGDGIEILKRYAMAVIEAFGPSLKRAIKVVTDPLLEYFEDLKEVFRQVVRSVEIRLKYMIDMAIFRLKQLQVAWEELNESVARPIRELTAKLSQERGGQTMSNAMSAGRLQGQLAHGASGQVDRLQGGVGAAVNQTNNFFGPHGDDPGQLMGAAIRHAGVSVAGGRR